jgi:hypothetical protein
VGEYLVILCTCIHRGETGLNVCGQGMEACPHSEFHMFEKSTEMSPRAPQFLLNIPPVDVQFRDTTLTVQAGIYRKREYLCVLLNF